MSPRPAPTLSAQRTPNLAQATGLVVVAVLSWAWPSASWALYKQVGPDGRVTYTDRPSQVDAKPLRTREAPGTPTDLSKLPFDLRQVAERLPVVFYAGKDCAPCNSARDWLKAHGIPFQEWAINTREDTEAFKKLDGGNQLPVLRIGSQRLLGFRSQEWASYLDLAGYPKANKLPADFTWPEPQALAPKPNKPAEAPPAATPSAPAAPVEGGAPSGFRF